MPVALPAAAAPAPYAATLRLTPDQAAAIVAAGIPGKNSATATFAPLPATATPAAPTAPASTGSAPAPVSDVTLPGIFEATADGQLRDIYARETSSHVATVRRWLAREQPHPAPHVLTEEVYRACHTLAGSSKMAEVRHGIRLAEPLNHWLRKSFDSGVGLDDSDLVLLADCMTAMDTVAGHLDESTGYFMVHDTLRARVARAELELERRVIEANAQSERTGVHAQPPIIEPLMPPPPANPNPAPLTIDYDPEVAAIFCEEASELLESSQSALQSWNSSPGSTEYLAALKRPLHTFKGGARMAGISAMGDLSHELESLIIQIALGTASGDERARGIAQEAVDELARMREQVSAGRPVPQSAALIANIQAVARGVEPAFVAPAPRVVAVPVAVAPVAAMPPAATVPAPAAPTPVAVAPAAASAAAPVETDDFDIVREFVPTAPAPAVEPAAASVAPAFEPAPEPEIAAAPAASPFAMPPPAPVPPGREPVGQCRARRDGARQRRAARSAAQQCRRSQHLARAPRAAARLGGVQPRRAVAHRHASEGTAAQARDRDRGADPASARRASRAAASDFDPLELDRYSSIQQFSRALAESASDVASLQQLLESLVAEAQNLLQQQARTVTELQNGLMRTRMVSFQRHVQRLARIVRQAASDTGKQVELIVEGAAGELDRQVLERMLPPFEHCCATPSCTASRRPRSAARAASRRPGHIHLQLQREGAEVIVEVRDDGAGMNLAAIRDKGLALGLIRADQALSDEDAMQLILEPGFSTAGGAHPAGRPRRRHGRGGHRDQEARRRAAHGDARAGEGTRFTIRLPFTLAVSHALVVRTGDEYYALPLPTVEGVVRLPRDEVAAHLRATTRHLRLRRPEVPLPAPGAITSAGGRAAARDRTPTIPVVLVRAGEHSTGLVADELVGSREIVVKSVGPADRRRSAASPAPPSSATAASSIILDIGALVRAEWRGRAAPAVPRERDDRRTFALVVDDSITVRRVTQRLLERNGMRVLTARDGMDAVDAAAGERAGHHPARHRDAAHGRLRGRGARARRPAPAATCRSS